MSRFRRFFFSRPASGPHAASLNSDTPPSHLSACASVLRMAGVAEGPRMRDTSALAAFAATRALTRSTKPGFVSSSSTRSAAKLGSSQCGSGNASSASRGSSRIKLTGAAPRLTTVRFTRTAKSQSAANLCRSVNNIPKGFGFLASGILSLALWALILRAAGL